MNPSNDHPIDCVVVLSGRDDIHARCVAVGLHDLGVRTRLFSASELPYENELTIRMSTRRLYVSTRAGDLSLHERFVFWNRRRGSIQQLTGVHASDQSIAEDQWNRFFDSAMLELSAAAVMTVNDYKVFHATEHSKLHQLATAQRCGLLVPETLVTNDPVALRSFIHAHAPDVIFKSLGASIWRDDGNATHWSVTTRVSEADLPSDHLLRSAPGIFQRAVSKAYELRVHVIGRIVIAARIDVMDAMGTGLDWRTKHDEIVVSAIDLPAEIEIKLWALCDQLNLLFGCIDMIVTPDGEHVFLEINQMGQFLWVEQRCPSLRLLGTFCGFLKAGDPRLSEVADTGIRFDRVFSRANSWTF